MDNSYDCNDCKIQGVDCDVVSCKYHSRDNCCCAEEIKVESHSALRKGETFCGTFAPKTSGC